MRGPRGVASWLLRTAAKHAPDEGHDWACAMLRELDFIEGDWRALWWALGSTKALVQGAIAQQYASGQKTLLGRHSVGGKAREMRDIGRKATWLLMGVVVAAVFAVFAYGLLRASIHFFPSLYVGRVPWVAWLTVIVLPEAAFATGVVMLWRRRKPMAVGILLSAMLLATHFVMHIMSHWNG